LKPLKILVVGQTPPPYYGQAMMIRKLLEGQYRQIKLFHVSMTFSRQMDEIGKFTIRKLGHLFAVIISIVYMRLRYGIPILYYPPAGPNRIPMYRDIAILLCTRWVFKKTVFKFHAGGISELYGRLLWIEKLFFRLTYFFPDLAIRLNEYTPPDGEFLKSRRIVIVPNGIEDIYPKFLPTDRRANSIQTILFVGVLRESKGVMVLLEASKRLMDSGRIFKTRLMGEFESDEFRNTVDAYLKENDLLQRVEFLGLQTGDEKWKTYSEASVFVCPTYFESEAAPGVIIEAMQFRIPVVATRWRGIPSMVEDGRNGFLVPVGDSRSLAEKIALLLDDPELRRDMGEQGRKIYLENFTVEKFWQKMEEALSSVAGNNENKAEIN
jgi:glycosyltransferase involved in cell wall biosynthesis